MVRLADRSKLLRADGTPKRIDKRVCALCGFDGVLGHHIHAIHPEWTYKSYVEAFHPKFCDECKAPIEYKPLKYQWAKVTYCSMLCSRRGRSRKKNGIFLGPKSSNWRGGRFTTSTGYVFLNIDALPEPSRSWAYEMTRGKKNHTAFNYIQEHRIVMAQVLGRPLTNREQVHHRNAKRGDNRPENLELRVGNHGSGATASALTCPHCGKSYHTEVGAK